jgi:hypothetical protein
MGSTLGRCYAKRDENSIDTQADIAVSERLIGKALLALGRHEQARAKLENARQRLSTIKERAQLTSEWKECLAQIEAELAKLNNRQ